MINALNSKKKFELFILFFITNILLSKEMYKTFKLKIPLVDDKLGEIYISDVIENYGVSENKEELKDCQWIPSLINPILLIPFTINIKDPVETNIQINNTILFSEKNFGLYILDYFLFNLYNLIMLRPRLTDIGQNCYFGMSSGFSEYINLDEDDINLNKLKNSTQITNKIFSFSKWPLNNQEEIISYLYFGDIHENFNSSEGIIGTCDSDKEYPFFGCIFSNILFNNNSKELKNEEGDYYKIYFASEIYDIIIPHSFKEEFDNITDYACIENDFKEVSCNISSFFKNQKFAEIELSYQDKMNITIEIDSVNRFLNENEETQNKTRIKFSDNKYFILPLIMFKNFHIQFNAENNKINFYTTDSRILQVKKDQKKEQKKKGSSKAGTVFLIIFIILLVIALGFGIIWLIRKRRNSLEKNINKYNKFEDEENFQDMNEKRVF